MLAHCIGLLIYNSKSFFYLTEGNKTKLDKKGPRDEVGSGGHGVGLQGHGVGLATGSQRVNREV